MKRLQPLRAGTRPSKGSVLVALLWCLAFLAIIVIGALHTSRLDLSVVKHHGDLIQAHYLALAGIEKGKALLYQDSVRRKRSSKNHTGELFDAPRDFKDVALGRGLFRVFHPGAPEEGGGLIYGIADEESRLNLNHASTEELGKLYGMTPETAAAILDFRDEDNTVTPGGAEAEDYANSLPPIVPRNGPFQTVRELAMVRGVARDLLLDEDANQNGLLDPGEDDGNATFPPDNRDGILDAGWSGVLSVDSGVANLNAAGENRVNVQTADENTLASVNGLNADLARAIVASRGRNRLENLADLLDVAAAGRANEAPANSGPGSNSGSASVNFPGGNPALGETGAPASGEKVISEDLLMEVADDLTTVDAKDQPGLVNINTADATVLACLPGISREIAQAIINYRRSAGFFPNIAWLLKVPGMNRQVFKQVSPRITARSETYRILSEGEVPSTGARKRLQVIVRLSQSNVETLSYREGL